jgi:pimeloyl-ACP methyl ester carboxylesterase
VELCWQGGQTPPTLDLNIESCADDVLWAIRELGLESFFVGGHSIGGMITVEIAGRDVPGLVGAIPMEGWTHHTVVETAFNGVVTGELTAEQQTLYQAYRARGLAHLTQEQITAIASIWRNWNGYGCLERSTVPILEVWGDRGKSRPDRKALQIPDKHNIEIAWIPNSAHLLMLQAPDALADAVETFSERIKTANIEALGFGVTR